MLKMKAWQKERDTLQRIAQMLGKYKLASAFQEPQWAHVILDVTTTGFSTGLLFYHDCTYTIQVDLQAHRIEIVTDRGRADYPLKDGTSIQTYYNWITRTLKQFDIDVSIHPIPQEVADLTPFDEDTVHHHYNEKISLEVLQLMKFAVRALSQFIAPFRARKVKPGLFWGTFDISTLLNYNAFHETFKPSQVIEYAAFDEHFIEFGFWFGDETFEGPTFFILPYPFVDASFTFDQPLSDHAYFDTSLTELIYPLDAVTPESFYDLQTFFNQGFHIFKDHLSWQHCQHYEVPLKMVQNQIGRLPIKTQR
ncbi:hypothetical protein GLV88_02655 [Staphylococcus hyicus]|uniref:DUF5996 family protein n=1 Tax=Staphylococcus hyicus TaxID=1284 RepID=UPI0014310181|nr:DUF5996 family protein [Staphylococcus hyicus]NJH99361.1 hypothetical protein [Staphylococcus hyicus]NJI30512.1 hypothetical protein [Staphylococcus hyicus]